jgi:hypothetical protein
MVELKINHPLLTRAKAFQVAFTVIKFGIAAARKRTSTSLKETPWLMRAEFGASTLVTLVSALVLNGCLWNAVVVSDTIGKPTKMTQLNVIG